MIRGIFHTAVTVRDMEKTLWFYCNLLGGRHIFTIQHPDGRKHIESVQYPDGTFLEFFYPDPLRPLGNHLGNHHFSLYCDDIFETAQLLRSHDITILSDPAIVRDQNWQLWCLDPNGYRVEIMQVMPDCPQRTPGFPYTILK